MTKPAIDFTSEWRSLATAIGLGDETAKRLGAELLARHREPHRSYHTDTHVEAVIGHLDTLGARTPVTLLAAFFHDVIYDPLASDNEERSADLAAAWLPGFAAVDDVVAMVLATAGHGHGEQVPEGLPEFLDADLAILAAEPSTYRSYVSAIRNEYAHLDDATFVVGRRQFLDAMLARPALFSSVDGRDRWEDRARANIAGELAHG